MNRQTKSLKSAVAKAKKVLEGNFVPVLTGYKGKKPIIEIEFREHGRWAFNPDPEKIARKNARRQQMLSKKRAGLERLGVTSLIG